MRASAMACSLAMRAFSMVWRAEICACSDSVSRNAPFARHLGALHGRAEPRCRAPDPAVRLSLSRSMSSACRSASRLRVRILIIDPVRCRLRSLPWPRCLTSAGQASASKRFDGLKNSRVGLVEVGDRHRF